MNIHMRFMLRGNRFCNGDVISTNVPQIEAESGQFRLSILLDYQTGASRLDRSNSVSVWQDTENRT